MGEVDSKIKATLEAIKNNPSCTSESLDGDLVHQLVEQGYLSGLSTTDDQTFNITGHEYEYANLNVTFDGEHRLERAKVIKSSNPNSIWRLEKLWLPLLLLLLAFVLTKYFA